MAMMTFGHRVVRSFSQKQKLNAKSPIEAELLSVDDVLPQILWTQYFLEEQGYTVTANTTRVQQS